MNISAIIQARMGSTRLPGKVLKEIKGKKIIDYVIERTLLSENINDVIIATTRKEKDDVLEKYAVEKNIKFYRGNEHNVLSRYYHSAKKFNTDVIVRITSDCPLIDPGIIDQIITTHLNSKVDYTTNKQKRTYPRGFDVEVFNFKTLEIAYKNAEKDYEKEHVTPYIRERCEKFKLKNVEAEGKLNRPDIRITVDTKEDYQLIKKIIIHFDDIYFTAEEIIDFINQNEHLLDINKHIKQKKWKKE